MSRIALPAAIILIASVLVAAGRSSLPTRLNADERLLGQWVPHPAAKDVLWPSTIPGVMHDSNPHHDNWQLTFSADGSATFTGTTRFITQDGIPVDDSKIVASEFLLQSFILSFETGEFLGW